MDHIPNRPSQKSMVERGESNIILVVSDYDQTRYLLHNLFLLFVGFSFSSNILNKYNRVVCPSA